MEGHSMAFVPQFMHGLMGHDDVKRSKSVRPTFLQEVPLHELHAAGMATKPGLSELVHGGGEVQCNIPIYVVDGLEQVLGEEAGARAKLKDVHRTLA